MSGYGGSALGIMQATTTTDDELRARLGFHGRTLVVGLGQTGLSCARFLHRLGLEVAVTDDRDVPPGLHSARTELPDVALYLGGFSTEALARCERVVVSPGVALSNDYMRQASALGLDIIGDIELFARCVDAPVLAVTGSNGKSTVTALLGEMARASHWQARVGGNIGTPALDLLGGTVPDPRVPDLYVLELSSFQLETTRSLAALAAAVLNVSADHLDRYRDMDEYLAAKLRIWQGGGVAVLNRDDPLLRMSAPEPERVISFGADEPPDNMSFGLRRDGGRIWLARGQELLLAADEIGIRGRHNLLNALAALALGSAAGLPQEGMTAALRDFRGLPHRTQWIGERDGVVWYNDSKGTNVGATLAAVDGLDGPLVLIAGGLGKDQDFSPLRPVLSAKARAVVLIGLDADRIEAALAGAVPVARAQDMAAAVACAARLARPGDAVLLSPACASFDMFAGYEDRGARFIAAFEELAP